MKKKLEDRILDLERIKILSGMSLDRLLKYDREELAEHYDEIISVFCFLNEQIEEKCKGITCGRRPTSCADQLACAVREAYEAGR